MGEGWRQGLGQQLHGHVCSGITREKKIKKGGGVGGRVIKKAIQELENKIEIPKVIHGV